MAEVVALIVSLAALVVSAAALYLTSLAAADIEVDHVPRNDEVRSGTFSGAFPQDHYLQLAVFISNTGARAGILEELRVADLEWHGDGDRDPFWTRIWRTGGVTLPTAFEGGDVETAILGADLLPAGGDIEAQAAQLGGMRRLRVTVRWSFVRTRGLPVRWRVVPKRWKRTREHVARSRAVEVDATSYRDATIQHWMQGGFPHLVALAEGKTADDTDSG